MCHLFIDTVRHWIFQCQLFIGTLSQNGLLPLGTGSHIQILDTSLCPYRVPFHRLVQTISGHQGHHLGGAGGATAPLKPQLVPHISQAPSSNSSWFSIIPTKIQMCHHFNITFSYILHFFFFFFFVTKTGP